MRVKYETAEHEYILTSLILIIIHSKAIIVHIFRITNYSSIIRDDYYNIS